MKPGMADMGATLRGEAGEDVPEDAAATRCNEVVLSGEAGGGPGLALRPLGPDLLNVPVEVDGGGFCSGDSKAWTCGGRGVMSANWSSSSIKMLLCDEDVEGSL